MAPSLFDVRKQVRMYSPEHSPQLTARLAWITSTAHLLWFLPLQFSQCLDSYFRRTRSVMVCRRFSLATGESYRSYPPGVH